MKELYGTVVPIVTPFTEKDSVDEASLKRLVDHVIDGGLQGLYPCGTTGEMLYLSIEERKRIAEVTVEQAAGRVPVFVHAGAYNLKDTVELSRHAFETGADGIGIVTPAFFRLSDRELLAFYEAVSGSVPEDFPVYLYGIPQNAGNDLSPQLCGQIAERCPNVVGIKYSYPDLVKMQRMMLIRDHSFSVLTGADNLYTAFCVAGGRGVVSGNAMILREHYSVLWKALCDRDYALAERCQRRTNLLNDILCRGNNIAAYKALLKEEGILKTDKCRRPMMELATEEREALIGEMRDLDYKKVLI